MSEMAEWAQDSERILRGDYQEGDRQKYTYLPGDRVLAKVDDRGVEDPDKDEALDDWFATWTGREVEGIVRDDGYCWGDLEVIGEAGDALNAIMKTREESNGKMEEPTSLEQAQAAADLAWKEFTDLVC